MTENQNILKSDVKIPVWMFGIIVTLMLSLLGFTAVNATYRQQVVQNTIEISNMKNNEIKQLQSDKADKVEVVTIQTTLVRIENKLDNYILLKIK
jgi:nitrogen fixation protein FixH